jgi:hypothetical protein
MPIPHELETSLLDEMGSEAGTQDETHNEIIVAFALIK